ncbi:MAG: YggS family pyridoxal phosphate-dependent enzyme [Candidatus Woesearchaeota archaeon]
MKLPEQSLTSINKDLIKEFSSRKDIALVAATKYIDANIIRELVKQGVKDIGENRIKDFEKEYAELKDYLKQNKCRLHFIGHLQSNKAKKAVEMFDVIQSIDSEKIAAKVNDIAKEKWKMQDVMIQVNIGKEEQKYGVMPENVIEFYEKVKDFSNINVIGLMCIAPDVCAEPNNNNNNNNNLSPAEQTRPYFRKMKYIFDKINDSTQRKLKYLSMGMSNDYRIAIEEGSNMIRLGRVLYRGIICACY